MKIASLALVASLAAAGLAQAADSPAKLMTMMKNPAGADMGMATLAETPNGVLVHAEFKGLPPGWHGVHLHEKGDCSKADFTSAGPHVHAMPAKPHGLFSDGGGEAGDLPNIFVGADGTANAEFYTTTVSLAGAGGRPALADADGAALVVHAKSDDQATQPIGGAGARIACGVIH